MSVTSDIQAKSVYKMFRPPSVYGGAGGYGTRISAYGGGLTGGHGFHHSVSSSTSDILLAGNEKMTMQNLNERLSSYLEKVRSLEYDNQRLEMKILEWTEKSTPVYSQDYSVYYKTIEDLQNKIAAARLENSKILLEIDNSRLAAEDFRIKYESELKLKQSVEADIAGLLRLIDEFTLIKANLEHEVESIREELGHMKRSHQEETEILRRNISGTVKVEVDAAPSKDLMKIIDHMRQEYEALAEKYRQEAKDWFENQVQVLTVEISTYTQEHEGQQNKLIEWKRNQQSLEIELQSQLSVKTGLQKNLGEIEARYGMILTQIQTAIERVQIQLMQLRSEIEQQSYEYNSLRDIKLRLEEEISLYRHLLEGEDRSGVILYDEQSAEEAEKNKIRKIKTIVTEMVDGKVVSSEVSQMEEKIVD